MFPLDKKYFTTFLPSLDPINISLDIIFFNLGVALYDSYFLKLIEICFTTQYLVHVSECSKICISSVKINLSVGSDSLQPHGLKHNRLPCPSPTSGAYQNSCLSCRHAIYGCHPSISASVIPFSFPQSFPASQSFPVSQHFASGDQSIGASVSVSVLPMNIQG